MSKNYINDWGVEVVGYQSVAGGLYHNEDRALAVSEGMRGNVHSLVRFIDCYPVFEALEHILKYDGDRLGAVGLSLASTALKESRRT